MACVIKNLVLNYCSAGATASDNVDGDLTSQVVMCGAGTISLSAPTLPNSPYLISYQVGGRLPGGRPWPLPSESSHLSLQVLTPGVALLPNSSLLWCSPEMKLSAVLLEVA
jgi:hypothetical protein